MLINIRISGAGRAVRRLILPGMFLAQGCDPESAAPEARIQAAAEATLQSAAELGSYVLTAQTGRTWTAPGGSSRATTEDFELRWEDPDLWSLKMSRDGRQQQRIVIYGAEPWAAMGDTPLSRRSDPEPYRVQLQQSWDPWKLATDPVRERIQLTMSRDDVYEGRPARVYAAALSPAVEGYRATWEATLVEGEIWLDEQTAIRLSVDLHVQAQGKKELLDIRYRSRLQGIGASTGITSPQLEEGAVLDPQREPRAMPERPAARTPPRTPDRRPARSPPGSDR